MYETAVWVFFAVVVLYVVIKGFTVVDEATIKIVERLGKYNRVLTPGVNFLLPFIESIKKPYINTFDTVDGQTEMRALVHRGAIPTFEIMLDPPEIDAISRDNAVIYPDSILYFRIIDPVKAVYEIEDLGMALYKLLETTLRQSIGTMDSDEIIKGREKIGASVKSALEEASAAWGTQITRVEIEEIRFNKEVTQALSDQRAAELKGRAQVIEAEREKEAVILAAEAKYEEERLAAEADFLAESRGLEGQAKGAAAIAKALEKAPDAYVALQALEAQRDVADAIGKSKNSLIIPQETAGLAGAIKSIEKILDLNVKKKK
tara:strand:+ start:1308 stop:2264 length:957 start_codon:yes stop_codon:yes gene_type:complete